MFSTVHLYNTQRDQDSLLITYPIHVLECLYKIISVERSKTTPGPLILFKVKVGQRSGVSCQGEEFLSGFGVLAEDSKHGACDSPAVQLLYPTHHHTHVPAK